MSTNSTLEELNRTIAEVGRNLSAIGVDIAEADLLRDMATKLSEAEETLLGTGVIPAINAPVNKQELMDYLHYSQVEKENREFSVGSIELDIVLDAVNYVSAIFSPVNKRIYLIPRSISFNTIEEVDYRVMFHYFDCLTEEIVAYNPLGNDGDYENKKDIFLGTLVGQAEWSGGRYLPSIDSIVLFNDTAIIGNISCSTGLCNMYEEVIEIGYSIDNPYVFKTGAYSPIENRLYFIPNVINADENTLTEWKYLNIDTFEIETLNVNLAANDTVEENAYGQYTTYSPLNNRIYLVPMGQCKKPTWHYIDCNTGTLVSYTHGIDTSDLPEDMRLFLTFVYSPIKNRIYMVAFPQGEIQTQWYYIVCETGLVAELPGIINGISELVMPTNVSLMQNKIYLFSGDAVNQPGLNKYFDCETETFVAINGGAFNSMIVQDGFDYSKNRFYPMYNIDETWGKITFHYIQEFNTGSSSLQLANNEMFK